MINNDRRGRANAWQNNSGIRNSYTVARAAGVEKKNCRPTVFSYESLSDVNGTIFVSGLVTPSEIDNRYWNRN